MLKKAVVTGWLAALSVVFVSGQTVTPQRQADAAAAPAAAVAEQRALIDKYCVTCHNQKLKTANLLLDELDLTSLSDHPEIAEKVIRKLRAGMMPPNGMPRPEPAILSFGET